MLDKEHRLAFSRLGNALNETKKQKEANLPAKKEPEKNSVTELNVSYLPEIISENITLLSTLSSKVDAAQKAAQRAESEAEYAAGRKSKLGHHTEAIEALQDSAVATAKSQKEIVNAQRVSFDFQQRLAEISKLLFNLGVTNIAMNRTVCRELELKLSGASKEKLNDLAKQELMNVVSQLKAQEDMMVKQEKQMQLIKEHTLNLAGIRTDMASFGSSINAVEKNIDEIEEDVDAIEAKNEEQDKLLKSHDENIDEIEEDVDAIEAKNEEQDKLLKSHDENIDEIEEDVEENRADIQKNLDKINDLIAEVAALKNAETEAEKKIAQAKIIALVSGGIGVVSLALSALIALGII